MQHHFTIQRQQQVPFQQAQHTLDKEFILHI